MKRLSLMAAILVLSSGCAGRYYWGTQPNYSYGYAAYPTAPAQIVVNQPPPPPPLSAEIAPPQPSASSVWVAGHWSYNGMWTWVGGTWVNGYAGWVWTAPVIVVVNGTHVLHRGYFRQPAYQPAPAYTQPNRIHISVDRSVASNTTTPVYQAPPARPAYQAPPAQPAYQAPAAQRDPGAADQPRQLEVPGAVVRTPPRAPVAAPAAEQPPAVATPAPERPVLVAPGATVSRTPTRVEPSATPPVLSNVPPVADRPAAADKTPDTTPGAPVVQAPSKAPAATPTQVTPSGMASIGARRATANPAAATPATQAQQATRGTDASRATNTTQAPPKARTSTTRTNAADAMRTQQSQATRATRGPAPAQTTTRATRETTPAPARAATRATRTPSTRRTSSATRTTADKAPRETATQADAMRRAAGRKEPENKPADKAPTMTCTLLTVEAPRGGQLDVQGEGFGSTPIVRIGGKVTRILRRNATEIRVQIPRDSDGGSVTVQAGTASAECGSLTIIGTNR